MYGWAISQKLPVTEVKWNEETSQFNEDFTEIYNKDSDIGYFIETYVLYPEKLHELHNDLPFLPEKMTIEKLMANLHD